MLTEATLKAGDQRRMPKKWPLTKNNVSVWPRFSRAKRLLELIRLTPAATCKLFHGTFVPVPGILARRSAHLKGIETSGGMHSAQPACGNAAWSGCWLDLPIFWMFK